MLASGCTYLQSKYLMEQRTSSFHTYDGESIVTIQKQNPDHTGIYTITHCDKPKKIERSDTPFNYSSEHYRVTKGHRSSSKSSSVGGRVKSQQEEHRMNTYNLNPEFCFQENKIYDIVQEEMNGIDLQNMSPSKICTDLSNKIKARVKLLPFSRYKYIVTVTVGDCLQQGLKIASRCIWDEKRDGYLSIPFKHGTLFIIINVFALYFS